MQRRFDHVSDELVCSGIGIPHLYGYLRERGDVPEAPELARQLATVPDPTRLLVAAGLAAAGPDPLSAATLALFVEILAAEAGNLALKVLASRSGPCPCWRVGASPSCSRACRSRSCSPPPP